MRRKKIVLVLLAVLGFMSMSGCCVDSYWFAVGVTDLVVIGASGLDGCHSSGSYCGGGGGGGYRGRCR